MVGDQTSLERTCACIEISKIVYEVVILITPRGFERVIINDKKMQCMAELDKFCPSFGYVALSYDEANARDMWTNARLENKSLNTLGGHSSISVG